MFRRKSTVLAAAAAATIVSSFAGRAWAANATWTGANDTFWLTPGNWDNGGPYTLAPGDGLFFGSSGPTSSNNNITAGSSFGGLTFLPGAQGYTLDGNDIVLTGPIVVDSGNGNTQTINFNITGATGLSMSSSTSPTGNNLTLNGNVSVGSLAATGFTTNSTTPSNLLTIGAGKTLTVGGNIVVGTATATDNARAALAVTGSSGSLVAGATGATMTLSQPSTSATNVQANLDLTGLNAFSFNGGATGAITIGTGQRGFGSLALANSGTNPTNTLTVGTISLSTGGSSNAGGGTLTLGTGSNVINANNIIVGTNKGGGAIVGTSGGLKIRGAGGTDADRANIAIANRTNSGTPNALSMNLGTMNVDAKVATLTLGTTSFSSGSLNTNNATVTFGGGTFDVNSVVMAVKAGAGVLNGTTNMVLNITGGTFQVNNSFSMANTNSTTNLNSIINLTGGTLSSNADVTQAGALATQVNINVNGGLLDMHGHNVGTAAGPISLNAQSGTVQNLGLINGTGGLQVNGSGTVVLAGANTYTGATVVSSGTLSPAAGATIASPVIEVRSGGFLDTTNLPTIAAGKTISGNGTVMGNVTVAGSVSPGNNTVPGSTAGQLNFANNLSLAGGGTLNFELNNPGGGNDTIQVGGDLNLNGVTTLRTAPLSSGYQLGTYTLMNYASRSGAGTIQLPGGGGGGLITRQTFNLVVGATQTSLDISGTPAASLTWIGNGSTNVWDHTATLWNNGGSNDKFFDLDSVTFDDSGSDSPQVNLTGALVPASVTVNGDTKNYNFSGSGSLTTDALTKNGNSTLSISNSGVNSLGTVTINGGTLRMINNGATSANAVTVNGGATLAIGAGPAVPGAGNLSTPAITNNGTIALNRPGTYTLGATISGGGTLTKAGSGETILSATNSSYTGATLVSGGTLTVASLANGGTNSSIGASASDASNLVIDGGAIRWTGGGVVNTNRNMTITANGATFDASPAVTANGTFSSTNAITFPDAGPRTLVFTGTDPAPLVVGNNVFALQINDQDSNTGKTAVVKNGSASWQFNNAGNNYSGGTVINQGRIRANAAGAYGTGTVVVNDGGQAYISAGNVTINNGLTINGVGPVEQPGTEVAGSYGALRLAANGDVWAGSITLGGDARITARGATGAGASITGQITGNHAIEFGNIGGSTTAGIIILNNGGTPNNWTGNTTISGSTLRLGAADQIPNGAAAGNVIVNGSSSLIDATFDLNGQNETINGLSSAGDVTRAKITSTGGVLTVGDNNAGGNFAGTIAGGGAVTKIGTGSQTFSGNNTYSGVTTVKAGKLVLAGGAKTPVLNNGGADVQGGRLVLDYNDTGVTPDVKGILTAGYGQTPKFNSGQIRTSNPADTAKGLGWKDDAAAKQVTVGYTWYGDANLDGQVDVTDLGALATNWQTSSVWAGGDFNYDGFVDVTDLGALATNWQQGVGSPLGPGSLESAMASVGLGNVSVPEPATIGLIALGFAGVLSRRSRRSRRA